jgi:flagellin FlaB
LAGIFDTAAFAADATFGIIVLEDADSSCLTANPVINRGDHVLLTISAGALFGGLVERTDIWGMAIPESGASGVFAFRTPASYPETVYDLY